MAPSTLGPMQGLSPRSAWAGNRKQGAGPPGTRGSSCLGPSGGEAGGGTDQGWAQGPLPTVVSVFPSVQGRPGVASISARTRTWARRVWVLGKEPHLLGREYCGQAQYSPRPRPSIPGQSHMGYCREKRGRSGWSSLLEGSLVLRWPAGWLWEGGNAPATVPPTHQGLWTRAGDHS